MEIWLSDNETGIECGINSDGDLFLGDKHSGCNWPDTKRNREKMVDDFCRYTGRQKPIMSASGKPITDVSVIDFSR